MFIVHGDRIHPLGRGRVRPLWLGSNLYECTHGSRGNALQMVRGKSLCLERNTSTVFRIQYAKAPFVEGSERKEGKSRELLQVRLRTYSQPYVIISAALLKQQSTEVISIKYIFPMKNGSVGITFQPGWSKSLQLLRSIFSQMKASVGTVTSVMCSFVFCYENLLVNCLWPVDWKKCCWFAETFLCLPPLPLYRQQFSILTNMKQGDYSWLVHYPKLCSSWFLYTLLWRCSKM